MDMWAEPVQTGNRHLRVCTFESMRQDVGAAFSAAMTFLGASIDTTALARAVEESAFDRLREQEHSKRVDERLSLDRDAFRFRQGIVGAHAHELSESDRDYLETVVSRHLHQAFSSYHRAPVA
jgi:hypothetical protein